MKKQEEMIWNYLDGQAGPEDRKWVERQLAEDESFREAFMHCQVLQQNLQEMEAEAPSMRFSQNVMDRLPAVSNLATTPLISAKWMRTLYGSVAGLIGLFLLAGFLLPAQVNGHDQQVDRVISRMEYIFSHIPENTLFFAGMITVGLLILLALDRWLKARFVSS